MGGYNKKKGESPNCIKNFKYYLKSFLNNTSVHGLKFLGEPRRSFIEKIWWVIFLSGSLYFCIYLIVDSYNKWKRAPVIVTLSTLETPINKIPFPAVTICPQIKTDIDKFDINTLTRSYENMNYTKEEMDSLHYMSLICSTRYNKLFENIEGNDMEENEAALFFMKVRPFILILAYKCFYAKVDYSLITPSVLNPVITNEGVCFSFNMLHPDDIYTDQMDKSFYGNDTWEMNRKTSVWTLENGYEINASNYDIPRRTYTSGTRGGFDVILLATTEEINYVCGDLIKGYKVIIHQPGEIPNTDKVYFQVGFNQAVLVSVKPNLMTTTAQLKHYLPKDRRCYFSEEKKLKFFKWYDQENCLSECLANITHQLCNCVGFFMPRDNLTKVCGYNSLQCMETAKGKLIGTNVSCNCLPSCTSLNYEIEVSDTNWNLEKAPKGFIGDFPKNNRFFSRLQVFFKDIQFVTLERAELYGQTDFLANCGGLLGLFMGFSFISFIEILYFISLRLICNVYKYGCSYWSASDELLEVKVS